MISQPEDGMDNYPSSSPSTPPKEAPETVDEENQDNASKTILAPKTALGDMTKVGDECMMRVVADHGDEVELEYSDKEDKKDAMSSDEEIDAMNQG